MVDAHLHIRPYFADPDVHPYDELGWCERTAEIKNHQTGEALFRQEGVVFPDNWSQLATNVVASKYFYGAVDSGNDSPKNGKREFTLRQLIDRVVDTISQAGIDQGLLDEESAHHFGRELKWLLVGQYGAFNSPVWFNVGLNHAYAITDKGGKSVYGWRTCRCNKNGACSDCGARGRIEPVDPYERPQASACFIIGLDDSIESIWELVGESARLFKYGSVVGADWSVLRSTKGKLSGDGHPSGPLSFMQVQDATGDTR